MVQIIAENLVKEYQVPDRDPGLRGAVKALFHPRYRGITAIDHIRQEKGGT